MIDTIFVSDLQIKDPFFFEKNTRRLFKLVYKEKYSYFYIKKISQTKITYFVNSVLLDEKINF